MFKLPPELNTLTYRNQSIEFSYGFGEVIQAEKYSRTIVKGGGGGGRISTDSLGTSGNIQPTHIEGQSIDVLDIWIRSDDGREVNCQLLNPNIGVRVGHRVLFLIGKGRSIDAPITIALKNDTIGDAYGMSNRYVYFILEDNPSGFFRNPKKKQE